MKSKKRSSKTMASMVTAEYFKEESIRSSNSRVSAITKNNPNKHVKKDLFEQLYDIIEQNPQLEESDQHNSYQHLKESEKIRQMIEDSIFKSERNQSSIKSKKSKNGDKVVM